MFDFFWYFILCYYPDGRILVAYKFYVVNDTRFRFQKQWILELAKLPKLEKLCYSCFDNSSADFRIDLREMIIASIPQLKYLGNSEINCTEKRSAEMDFLNKFGASPVAEENRTIVER